MSEPAQSPLISVVIPTYQRLEQLQRAVASVLKQEMDDFELLISDDEWPAGETWAYLEDLASSDARVRVIQNRDGQGQTSNVNLLFAQARGQWMKPLYDDDQMRPGCLAYFAKAARACPDASLIACYYAEIMDGQLVRDPKPAEHPWAHWHHSDDALCAMYLQETLGGGGLPSAAMARAEVVRDGVVFETPQGISEVVDSWWFIRLGSRGKRVCINRVLVEIHHGEVESLTSSAVQTEMDEQFLLLRKLMLPLMPKGRKLPSIPAIAQMLKLVRATARIKARHLDRKLLEAFGLMLTCWRPSAWWLYLRWLGLRTGLSFIKPSYPPHPIEDGDD